MQNGDAGIKVAKKVSLCLEGRGRGAGNAQRASHQASTTSEFAAVSVIDGRPDVLMANTAFSLDEKKACNNSFCNTGTPRQAEGAWKGEGTNWATKGSSDMRESMRNADKYGHVESSR